MTLLDELKRRNVLRVAAAYIVTAWLIIQVAETILPYYGLEYHVRTVITVLAIGFIPAMILAWALEWTPEGIRLDDGADDAGAASGRAGRKFDRIVIVILTIALAWFVYDKLVPAAPEMRYSIAVLPFDNESPDAVPDYLAEGLAGEVRDLLAKLPELLVVGRSSASAIETQGMSMVDIGGRLGVTHLLTGTVSQLGAQIRIRARLVDSESGDALWSRAYTGGLDEIFAIQDEIANNVIQGLELQMETSLPESTRTSPEVMALTLQAQQHWYDSIGSGTGEEMAALLEEALDIDPTYAPAMVWMIYANWQRRQNGLITAEEENERWLKLAGRILAIEPDNASVHNLFAWEALYVDQDLQAAASSYARALQSEPNDAEILRTAARFAILIGRVDDGLAMIERSRAIDPLCSYCLYHASKYHMYAGQYAKAEALRERFTTLHDAGYFEYGLMKLLQGKAEEALGEFRELDVRMSAHGDQNDGRAHTGLAMALHDLGRSDESDAQLALLAEGYGDENPGEIARVHAWRGEKDAAFEWLQKRQALGHRDFILIFAEPEYKNLHHDPRWTALKESLGFSEAQLAALDFPVEIFAQYHDELRGAPPVRR